MAGVPFTEDDFEEDRVPMGSRKMSESSLLNFRDIKIQKEIGRGAFSHVYKGTWRGKEAAIKKMRLPTRRFGKKAAEEDEEEPDTSKYLVTELAVLKAVQHKHLIKYHGACIHKGHIYVVTELLNGGDLQQVMKKAPVSLPWLRRVQLARDVAEGIAYLHTMEIIHRDVKTENILLENTWRPVVADFGFARKAEQAKAMTICGTPAFMAPEAIWGEAYSQLADVFSFGMVLAHLITRKEPGEKGFLVREPRTKFELNVEEIEAAADPGCPDSLLDLCKQCLENSPDDRLESALVHEWLQELHAELLDEAGEGAEGAEGMLASPTDIIGGGGAGAKEEAAAGGGASGEMSAEEAERRAKAEAAVAAAAAAREMAEAGEAPFGAAHAQVASSGDLGSPMASPAGEGAT